MAGTHVRRWGYLLLLLLCALFRGPAAAQSAEEAILQELVALGVPVREVAVSPDQVLVRFEQPPLDFEGAMFVSSVEIIERVVQMVPEVKSVLVQVDYQEKPLLEIVATGANLRGFVLGHLDPEAFFDSLILSERRYPTDAIVQNLTLLGIYDPQMAVQDGGLHMTFFQPEVSSGAELAEAWSQIFVWVADKAAGLDRVTLHVSLADGTTAEVGVDMESVLAYRAGTSPDTEFLGRWDIRDVASTTAGPGAQVTAPDAVEPVAAEQVGPGLGEWGLSEPEPGL